MSTATLVKGSLPKFRGDAALYRLDPPLVQTHYRGDEPDESHEYVIVSAIDNTEMMAFSGLDLDWRETYIFPATPDGEVADWGELDGSVKGTLDHADALRGAGYEVIA